VKSLISDNHVPLIMGLGQSTGFASVLPVLAQTNTLGQPTQSVLKADSDPFQPDIFTGSCSYADQVDVGIAYEMKHLGLKSLKGVTVGFASIQSASALEAVDETKRVVEGAGGTVVSELLPPATLSADVQVQDMQSKNVKFYLMLHAVSGAIVWLKSAEKFGFQAPLVGLSGITEAPVFKTAPYNVVKNMIGVNCFDPPYLAKTAAAKQIATLGKQYGIASDTDLTEANFTGGWTNAMILAHALRNANGDYSSRGLKKGYEKIKNLDPSGGMTPLISYGPKCHIGWPNPRPYTYNFKLDRFEPIGSWSQWAAADQKPYAVPGTCGVQRGAKK